MVRLRAPELTGAGWAAGPPLTLTALRGRIVLLHFWTAGCINCVHALRELRPVEERFADVLTVVGVHSPKFPHEAEPEALARAVARLGIRHPVLNDAGRVTWEAYAVGAWPTLVLVDARGRIALSVRGEGHRDLIAERVAALAEEPGVLRGAGPAGGGAIPAPGVLRFPGAVAPGPRGLLAVADSGNDRVLLARLGGEVVAVAGDGRPGLRDGALGTARLRDPQGLLAVHPERLLVADTGNHVIREVDLAAGTVRTVAGTGAQAPPHGSGGPAAATPLNSPWGLASWSGGVAIAMAGEHRIWWLDPVAGTVVPIAGTGYENLVDGPAAEALLAQPSGLASAGGRMWIADAESSALRVLEDGAVRTVVGRGLFVSGHRDGPASDALLQHPLGVAAMPDGAVAVADTYNGALRIVDPAGLRVRTAADGLTEPGGVAVVDGTPVVADTGAHRIVAVAGGGVREITLRGAPATATGAGGRSG